MMTMGAGLGRRLQRRKNRQIIPITQMARKGNRMNYSSGHIELRPGESFAQDFHNDGSTLLYVYGYITEKNRSRQIKKKDEVGLRCDDVGSVWEAYNGWLTVEEVGPSFRCTIFNDSNKPVTVRLRVVGQSE